MRTAPVLSVRLSPLQLLCHRHLQRLREFRQRAEGGVMHAKLQACEGIRHPRSLGKSFLRQPVLLEKSLDLLLVRAPYRLHHVKPLFGGDFYSLELRILSRS